MLRNYFLAGYPVLAIESADESQVLGAVIADAGARSIYTYSATQTMRSVPGLQSEGRFILPEAIAFAAAEDSRIVVIHDAQHNLANPGIYRAVIDAIPALKLRGCVLILVAPAWKLPEELRHLVPVLSIALPSRTELQTVLAQVATDAGIVLNGHTEALLDSAAGLTRSEAEDACALSIVQHGEILPEVVAAEKMRLIRSTGYLEVSSPIAASELGGLDVFRGWIESEVLHNIRDPQLSVRGVLLAGLPGTGKSLASKVLGSMLGLPVVRLDVAACKGSLVGQSEANIRHATTIVEAISPCVLWVDEVEKAVGGYRSSAQTDGGTTLGMVGHLLTWLQEHKASIVTIATCNDIAALPPEMTRAGRFDAIFAVGLPSLVDRKAIAEIHLRRLGCDIAISEEIAKQSANFTGAEIEQLVKSLARVYRRAIDPAGIADITKDMRIIAVSQASRVAEFQDLANKSMRWANLPERATSVGRKITAS